MIGFSVQTAVLFLLLYFTPVLGDVKAESRLVLAGCAAVIISAALLFLWDFVSAPARIHAAMSKELVDRHQMLVAISAREQGARLLNAYYEEGLILYRTIRDPSEYVRVMDEWVARAESELAAKFSVADQLTFRRGALQIQAWLKIPDAPEDWMKATEKARWGYSGRLGKIIDIIEFSGGNYLANIDRIDTLARRSIPHVK